MNLLDYFDIKETYQLPEALMNCLLDSDNLLKLCKAYKASYSDLSVDTLRDKFQDESANRTVYMQDFTPNCIGDILSGICDSDIQEVSDICSGTGGLTIKVWLKNKSAHFNCYELSERVLPVLLFNLAVRNINATVYNGDVITEEIQQVYRVLPGNEFATVTIIEKQYKTIECDLVVSNPPYSLKWTPPTEDYRMPYGIAPKGTADFAFIQIGLSMLKKGGQGLFILPCGILSRGNTEGKIRGQLVTNGLIKTVINLPQNLFKNTTIATNIIEMRA